MPWQEPAGHPAGRGGQDEAGRRRGLFAFVGAVLAVALAVTGLAAALAAGRGDTPAPGAAVLPTLYPTAATDSPRPTVAPAPTAVATPSSGPTAAPRATPSASPTFTFPPDVAVVSADVRPQSIVAGGRRVYYPAVVVTLKNNWQDVVDLDEDAHYTLLDGSGAQQGSGVFNAALPPSIGPGDTAQYVSIASEYPADWSPASTPLHVEFMPHWAIHVYDSGWALDAANVHATKSDAAMLCISVDLASSIWVTVDHYWIGVVVEDADGTTIVGDVLGSWPLVQDAPTIHPGETVTYGPGLGCTKIPYASLAHARLKVVAYGSYW